MTAATYPCRVWNGIESIDPPEMRHEHRDLLQIAKQMLANRQSGYPKLVAKGEMTSEGMNREIAVFEAIVADWTWIVTGEGKPGCEATRADRIAALDDSIGRVANMARGAGGFSAAHEHAASCVIAMRWHLERCAVTHQIAAFNHQSRKIAAATQQENARAA